MLAIGTRKLVTAALIEDQESNVLVGQRPVGSNYAGLWEFPGGKVQGGETPERCLERELEEELGVVSSADAIFARVRIDRAIELLVYRTRLIEGAPTAVEHDELRWVAMEELVTLAMPPADGPVVEFLQRERSHAAGARSEVIPPDVYLEMESWANAWNAPGLACRTLVEWSARLESSLGRALPERLTIRVNPILKSPDNMHLLRETVCHEFAHLAIYLLHGRSARPHGTEWRDLLERVGVEPRTGIPKSDVALGQPGVA